MTLQRIEKEGVLARLKAEYETLKTSWNGYTGYDNWFKRPLNNAHLNTVATYQHFVPAFKHLLAQNDGNLENFYSAAKAMTRLDKEQRHQQLTALTVGTNQIAATGVKWAGPSTEAGSLTPAVSPR
jgi:predicted aminopeptidase